MLAVSLLVLLVGFAAAVWTYNRYVTYENRLVVWPAKEVGETGPRVWQPKNARSIRMLSLDSGGILGLISLEVLKYLEEKSGKPIAELFDVIGGISTGAIIGTQLVLADDQGRPKHKASDVIELYDDQVARVFKAPLYHQILTLGGLFGPRYVNRQRIALAAEVYADANFRDLLLPVMIPSYSIEKAGLQLFTNWSTEYAEMFVAPLVSAATSAPTYFPGVELDLPSGSGVYMDGGVFGADPAQSMFLHALEHFPEAGVVLVSLGTGILKPSVDSQTSTSPCRILWSASTTPRPRPSPAFAGWANPWWSKRRTGSTS